MAVVTIFPAQTMPPDPDQRSDLARNPLDVIAHAHAMQEQLCSALEQIADGLPDDVDRRLCAQAASMLLFDLPLHHQDEEAGLFPILARRALPEDGIDGILARLGAEHAADTDFAAEIAETLELLSNGVRPANPDMLGYMLRGFFERYRRHVEWENALVLPLAWLRLGPEDLAALSARMELNRAQVA